MIRAVLFLSVATVFRAQAADPVMPAPPAALLQALPPAFEGAKVTRSEAETTYADWFAARATRVFEFKPTPPSQVSGSVEITLTDTGGFRGAIAAFANFKPGKVENVEKVLLGAVPVIKVDDGSGQRFSQALVSGRFVVEITTKGEVPPNPEHWLRALRFGALSTSQAAAAPASKNEARLVFIDELQPANNRSHTVSITDPQGLLKNLRSLPQLPEPTAR